MHSCYNAMQHGGLPAAVLGGGGPAVPPGYDFARALSQDGLDGEHHAGLEAHRLVVLVVHNLQRAYIYEIFSDQQALS